VSAAENALNREIELRNQGYANDVALREKELADAKAAQEKAVEEQKKIAGEQILLDAAFEGGEIEGVVGVRTYGETTCPDRRGTPCSWAEIPFKLVGDGERKIHEIDISSLDKPFFSTSLVFKNKGHAKIYSFEFK
jgi:hypothetical protein